MLRVLVFAVVAAFACMPLGALSNAGSFAAAEGAAQQAAGGVRIAPPEPVWDDAARLAELARRRARVAEALGQNSILVLFSAEPRVYTGDVDYEFRQENNLYYLTQLNQSRATLVLIPGRDGARREILFLPRRNPAREVWTGHMYSPEEARALSGVGEIWDAREFEPFVRALRARRDYSPKPDAILLPAQVSPDATGSGYEHLLSAMAQHDASLYLLLPQDDDSREFQREQQFAAEWAKSDTGLTVKSAWRVFEGLRQVKSPAELSLLQHAVDITIEAIERAMAAAGRAQREYEVAAEVDYTFKRRHADDRGYPSIVGCGANATTLHYEESEGACRPGDLLLMDVGAEYGHYSADVTRTFPVTGRFTPAQADLYSAVLTAQDAALRAARPGATLADIHHAATESLRESLLRLGLITERNSTQYGVWFMHGTSHWLGMNVHDVGPNARKLEPGMVFTVEPGLYVRADALDHLSKTDAMRKFAEAVRPAFEKYKGIGVRLEDDVVITADGARVMTAALPRTILEIENFMARAAQ